MGNARRLKLTTQGLLDLFDSDDSNKVSLRAPAAVLSDFTFTLPSAPSVGYLKSDISGNLTLDVGTSSAVTLDQVYDAGHVATVDVSEFRLNGDVAYVGTVFNVNQAGNGTAALIDQVGNNPGLKIQAHGTSAALEIVQDNGLDAIYVPGGDIRGKQLIAVGSGASIAIDNDRPVKWKDSGGTYREILRLNSSNQLRTGIASQAYPLIFQTGASYHAFEISATETMRISASLVDTPGALAVRTTEVLNNTASLWTTAGAAGVAPAADNFLAELRAKVAQATPSTLKGSLALYLNNGDVAKEIAYFDPAGLIQIGQFDALDAVMLDVYGATNAAVKCEHAVGDSHACLEIFQHANFEAVLIQVDAASTTATIDIVNNGSGKDIDGHASNWSVTRLGEATFAKVIDGGAFVFATRNWTIGASPVGTAGTKGDITWNNDPDPSEKIGWVCTTTGGAGVAVWKAFGAIDA